MKEVQSAAVALGLDCITVEIRRPQDIAPAFDSLGQRAQGLYLAGESLTDSNRLRIIILALGARLPTIWAGHELAEAGGFMSYSPNIVAQYRRAGELVDKILRGAKPADIPIEQPVQFDLVINLIVAKALGLEIAPSLLARADEVIEQVRQPQSWCDPAGESPAQVRSSVRLVASVAWPLAHGVWD
jgi:putative ABC transport system substrate-binding protein